MSEKYSNNDVIEDLLEIQKKKDSIRKTYRETKEMFERFEQKRLKKRRVLIYSGISAAACIAILLIVFVPSFEKLSGDDIFQKYYQRFELSYETRNSDSQDGIETVYELYRTGNSFEALRELELVPANKPDYIFYRSLILMDKGSFDEAYLGFHDLIELGGSYKWHALWYSALIDIKKENNDSAKSILKTLSNVPDKEVRARSKELSKIVD